MEDRVKVRVEHEGEVLEYECDGIVLFMIQNEPHKINLAVQGTFDPNDLKLCRTALIDASIEIADTGELK